MCESDTDIMKELQAKIKKLENELVQNKAHDIFTLKLAHENVAKCTTKRFMASGVIIRIQALNGSDLAESFLIQDGLSDETIAAIQADIMRTYELRLAYAAIKPKDKSKEGVK